MPRNEPRLLSFQDEKKLAVKIDALIKVFAHPEAQGDNLDETVRAIGIRTEHGEITVR